MELWFLSLLFTLSLIPLSLSQPPRAILIDCGATVSSVIDGRQWLPDTSFISTGTPKNLKQTNLFPTLSTVRSFPLLQNNNRRRKFCYVVPVYRTAKYLVRTTYYHGGVNNTISPPVFDQIVDGTLWSVVNTTEDYSRGTASYYEGVFLAAGKSMSVCLASNTYTDSDPFISALEFVLLADSLYNSTDFGSSLRLVARHSFGYNGSIISYPDDKFDRYWEPYGENNPTTSRGENVSINGFWNLPPLKVFQTKLTVNQPEPLEIQWPLEPLKNSIYYIALYFADDTGSSRFLNITINDVTFYNNLEVPQSGVALFANRWPLAGPTKIILTPAATGSTLGPLINGGELFEVIPVGGRTHTRDVIGLIGLKNSFENPPFDWNGDPCLPKENSWTGVTCTVGSNIGYNIRVIGLNLTSMGLLGSLSPNIANLTALNDLWLGDNSLSGSIPDLSTLRMLNTVHLEDNQFNGPFPSSLANIDGLQEVFLQNNNLTGQVPSSLKDKLGSNLRIVPGNSLLDPQNP